MTTIVKNSLILITGDPGTGKSFFACFLSSFYKQIFANFDILQNGKIVSNKIKSIEDVENLKFSTTKGVILLDEAGVNMNSRNFASDENKKYGKLAMLGRKFNKDIIVVAQMRHTVDKNVRMLCKYIFEMNSFFTGKNYLKYEAKLFDRYDSIRGVKVYDLIKWSELTGFSYNSLESSVIAGGDKNKKTFENPLTDF